MVSSSNAPGLKTVHACDSCARHRARWYCSADDAFLCENCDASVHSANPLARRHDRVGLQTNFKQEENVVILPAWHHACKRKARTPRQSKFKKFRLVSSSVVPELETVSSEDGCNASEEERLLYLVPVLDDKADNINIMETIKSNSECLAGFTPSDKELEEFAADMESLLWRGIGNDTFSIEELGVLDDEKYGSAETGEVKEETDDGNKEDDDDEETDLRREKMDINFDCRSGDEEHEFEAGREVGAMEEENEERSKKIGLRLNYEAVSVEWCASNGGESSPWMNGERPQFGPDDCCIDYLEMWVGGGGEMQLGIVQQTDMFGINSRSFNEGREARVSRYREKRRTRLFSNKIRYEVRKLNAEKRPRMKGRFVKTSSFVA